MNTGCAHATIVPYGDGNFGRCEECGDGSFPITEEAAYPGGRPEEMHGHMCMMGITHGPAAPRDPLALAAEARRLAEAADGCSGFLHYDDGECPCQKAATDLYALVPALAEALEGAVRELAEARARVAELEGAAEKARGEERAACAAVVEETEDVYTGDRIYAQLGDASETRHACAAAIRARGSR